MTQRLLGYSDEELEQSPYARFFNPELDPLQPQVADRQILGRLPSGGFRRLDSRNLPSG